MYSVVLMAALVAGGEAPDLGWRGGCGGCHGCWGCHGCYGGCRGCHGCYGCNGCYGGCYGGCSGYYGCHGASYGACYGYGYGAGCWGTPYSGYGPAGYSCYGGCGGYMSPGYGVPMPVVVTTPGTYSGVEMAPAPKVDDKKKSDKDEDLDKESVKLGNRARLIVSLPENAKLFIDDKPIVKTGTQKSFQTPALEDGDYYYEVRVEVMRDGKAVKKTRRVVVRAGEVTRADFSKVGGDTGVASAK